MPYFFDGNKRTSLYLYKLILQIEGYENYYDSELEDYLLLYLTKEISEEQFKNILSDIEKN